MRDEPPPLAVKISGDLACFTRPEMKVERVSYPVMTPTAAKGILESIFWKPEFRWRVDEVQVLNPIRSPQSRGTRSTIDKPLTEQENGKKAEADSQRQKTGRNAIPSHCGT